MYFFRSLLFFTISALGSSPAAPATITLESDKSLWASSVNYSVENLDFASLNTDPTIGPGGDSYTSLGVGPISLGPVTISGVGEASGPGLYPPVLNDLKAAAGGYCEAEAVACLVSTASGTFSSVNETSNMFVRIDLPAYAYAFGVNLENLDSEYASDFAITFPSQQISFLTIPPSSTEFFGFISSSPVAEVDIADLANVPLDSWAMDSPSVVSPEPKDLNILGVGVVFVANLWRRRSKWKKPWTSIGVSDLDAKSLPRHIDFLA